MDQYQRCHVQPQPIKNVAHGANVGPIQNVVVPPRRLESVFINSGQVIDSLKFTYTGADGRVHTLGPWGGQGGFGENSEFTLDCGEFVTEVSGAIGTFADGQTVIRALKLVTNCGRTYGPFGDQDVKEEEFTCFSPAGRAVVAFHGRSGKYLNSIGTYTV
uniref:Jacalin-type lectin domain-containing protein n=1 Tax=Leersia perrieri TaxID=77586 RepID=A0A0D9XAK4_9ORYZ